MKKLFSSLVLALALLTSASANSGAVIGYDSPFTLTVTADGTQPLTYQWRKDGAAISGATSDTYRIAQAKATDGAIYTVVVSNSAGSALSDEAQIIVGSPTPPTTIPPAIKAPTKASIGISRS